MKPILKLGRMGRIYLAYRRRQAALQHLPLRLRRKTVGGVPLQYMATFLTDQLLSYGRLCKWLGTHERN